MKIDTIQHALTFFHGGMLESELNFLYDIAHDLKVLELGSMVGMSSYVLASVAKEVHCVDVWSDKQDHLEPLQAQIYANLHLSGMYEKFNENCKEFLESGKIKAYRGLTQDLHANFEDNYFDLVVIDADHSYEGVARDFNLYRRKSKSLIAFHDYGDSMWTGIKRFCDSESRLSFIKAVDRLAVFNVYN